jgi:hypothetical protein
MPVSDATTGPDYGQKLPAIGAVAAESVVPDWMQYPVPFTYSK